ncbi:hypothetical protein [Alishewanella phage vB_AspM_Slicko01]|nr:hypothetical protein [Alishewanella phage vB_AspM_Slicko01]
MVIKMAYMSKELKERLAPAIKAVLKSWKVKGTIAIRNHMSLVVTIQNAPVELNMIGKHHLRRSNDCAVLDKFYHELKSAMDGENYNNSDVYTDYFDVGYYTDVVVSERLRNPVL